MIVIKNLFKSFETKKVLQGLNLNIEKGKSLAIIGSSGCGKSVLLKHIVGLLKPDSGTVEIDGTDINELNNKELFEIRKKFGFLFQSAALFDSLTVEENIALPIIENNIKISNSELNNLIEEKLELVKLPGIQKLKPAELSGGMRKRVGLARALITSPEFILYDEPTTGLDPITSDSIDELIFDLTNKLNITSITVTHDMFSVKNVSQKIVMMYEGKVHFQGNYEELINSNDIIITNFIKRTIQ